METTLPTPATPYRVKLARKKGWRLPPNTKKVSRPGKFGNPYLVRQSGPAEFWVYCTKLDLENVHPDFRFDTEAEAYEWLLYLYEDHLRTNNIPFSELAGYNLACWCNLDAPCHADVLLRVANGGHLMTERELTDKFLNLGGKNPRMLTAAARQPGLTADEISGLYEQNQVTVDFALAQRRDLPDAVLSSLLSQADLNMRPKDADIAQHLFDILASNQSDRKALKHILGFPTPEASRSLPYNVHAPLSWRAEAALKHSAGIEEVHAAILAQRPDLEGLPAEWALRFMMETENGDKEDDDA